MSISVQAKRPEMTLIDILIPKRMNCIRRVYLDKGTATPGTLFLYSINPASDRRDGVASSEAGDLGWPAAHSGSVPTKGLELPEGWRNHKPELTLAQAVTDFCLLR